MVDSIFIWNFVLAIYMVVIMTTRAQQLDKIEKEGWFRKGLTKPVSMSSTVRESQYRRFTFNNHSQGKK
jgi:hypothetical protein